MSAVTDFKSIKQKLDRMEQKAEFEAKNVPMMYGHQLVAVMTVTLKQANG